MCTPAIPALRTRTQEEQCECRASLDSITLGYRKRLSWKGEGKREEGREERRARRKKEGSVHSNR